MSDQRETSVVTMLCGTSKEMFDHLQLAFRQAGIGGPTLENINGDMRPSFTVYDSEGWGVFRLTWDGENIIIIPEYGG